MDAVWLLCVAVTWLTGVTGQGAVIQNIRLMVNNVAGTDRGRVEVLVEGVWGTVCSDQWDNLDAAVVCRQLSFVNGGNARINAFFGEGTGPIHIDDVACDGSETSLDACPKTTIVNCGHPEDAGVICNPNPLNPVTATTTTTPTPTVAPVPDNCNPRDPVNSVRLVNAKNVPGIGIVEVRNGGTWGSVCDDFFDENAAMVVCRKLCYTPGLSRAGASDDVGQARLPIILDDVRCGGNEAEIQDCNHAPWNTHNCADQEVAKVTCTDLNSQAPRPPAPILECREGFLIAAFNRSRDSALKAKHITVPNYNETCGLKKDSDNNTVVIRIPFDKCGTKVTQNATHLIYTNVINYAATTLVDSITRVNTYLVEVFCEMPRNALVTRPFDPQTVVVTQKSTGQFRVTMTFFRNNSFSNPVTETPLRLPLGEWLNIALQLESVDSRLKLVVPDCVATPNNDINNRINYPLFTNSCREEPTLTFFSLNQTRFGYRYQPFMFVNYPEVFLHCGAFVCLLDEESAQCDRSCNSSKPQPTTTGRRKREAEAPPKERIYVHSGPLVVYKLDNSMSIVERVGNPQTFSTTFTVPLPTTPTPSPDVTHRVGTSFKVHHESTTTMRTDEISGSGDGENQFMTSPTPKTSQVNNKTVKNYDVTTNKADVTTKRTDVTPKTEADDESKTGSITTTTNKAAITTKAEEFTKQITTPIMSTPIDTIGGFFVERGNNPNRPSSAQNVKVDVVRGYVPAFSSSGPLHLPSIVTIVCLSISVTGFIGV